MGVSNFHEIEENFVESHDHFQWGLNVPLERPKKSLHIIYFINIWMRWHVLLDNALPKLSILIECIELPLWGEVNFIFKEDA